MSELALTSGGSPRLPAPLATGGIGTVLERIRTFTAQPAVAKSLPTIAIVALLGLAALVWMAMSQPPQRDLFRGLSDADKAAVVETLKSAGIDYGIDRDSGALTVSESDFHQARMMLAQAGLPKSAPDGDAMISSLPMGASRAVENERLRGARELDLARTIEAIDAIESAKVHLAVEQPSVFLRERSKAAASVMVRMHAGRTLSEGQVQAIVNLVASSVPGLSPDGVSVVDQAGRLLSRTGEADAGAPDKQVEIQQRIEARYLEALTKLLSPIVGEGNFTAEVHADLDFAEVQATRETYPKDTAVIREEQGGWTNDAGAKEAGGIPGAIANQAPEAAQVTAAPGQTLTPPVPGATAAAGTTRTSENYNRSFQLGREVSITRNPVGTVRRLSVAVALKQGAKPRSVAELAALENLVKGAVGFDQARGDQIALTSRTFAPVEAAEAPKWWDAPWVATAARNGSALLIAALLIFGLARPMLRRRALAAEAAAAEAAAMQTPKSVIGNEIGAAIASEALADPDRPVTLDMIEAAPGYADRAALIRNFVRQDPARAALVVRDLIRSDMPRGEEQNG
ncbi:flagellar M-ring protein FliF [Sphingomonas oleivorans]|uniref:Flagellar M-ring protein n=1 Tax=Sphingomonas oleivorans TaxID=1735121 RepID=A0A2T5FYD4_9SPHN|nr:flagellar basal-body MS-ring/collar protein FliF [Sphingomonas oleivorans]PTQ11548.1 flagellar M-ring protein FliF [Sphingomonas oleivorans]